MTAWQRPTRLPILAAGQPDQGFATMRVTSPFGWRPNPLYPSFSSAPRTWHNGLDIGNHRRGDEVVAAAAGVVEKEGFLREPWSMAAPASFGWTGDTYGGVMVVLRHGRDFSVYAHLDRSVVNAGDEVAAGQLLGYVGDTGAAKGAAHLHFSVLLGGAEVDPWPLITAPPAETREQRLARVVLARRAQLPGFYAFLVSATGFTQELDGKPLVRETRLAVEAIAERLAAALGDEAATVVARTQEP